MGPTEAEMERLDGLVHERIPELIRLVGATANDAPSKIPYEPAEAFAVVHALLICAGHVMQRYHISIDTAMPALVHGITTMQQMQEGILPRDIALPPAGTQPS